MKIETTEPAMSFSSGGILLSKQHDLRAAEYVALRLNFRVLHPFPAAETSLRVMGVGLEVDVDA